MQAYSSYHEPILIINYDIMSIGLLIDVSKYRYGHMHHVHEVLLAQQYSIAGSVYDTLSPKVTIVRMW